jgi:hypothetical protein
MHGTVHCDVNKEGIVTMMHYIFAMQIDSKNGKFGKQGVSRNNKMIDT